MFEWSGSTSSGSLVNIYVYNYGVFLSHNSFDTHMYMDIIYIYIYVTSILGLLIPPVDPQATTIKNWDHPGWEAVWAAQ